MVTPIATFIFSNVFLNILNTSRHLRQYVIHGRINLVTIDGAFGLGITYPQTRVPITLPEIYMLLSQASLLARNRFSHQLHNKK